MSPQQTPSMYRLSASLGAFMNLSSLILMMSLCASVELSRCLAQPRTPETNAGEPVEGETINEPQESWWIRELKQLGVKISWTWGRARLASSAEVSRDGERESLASGEASLDGLGISLFSRPRPGWQINPSFGFHSLSSLLQDKGSLLNSPQALAGRIISTSCGWSEGGGLSSCNEANRYQINTEILYLGVWLGYVSRDQLWSLSDQLPPLRRSLRIGLEVTPLNLIWAESILNRSVMSDELYFTWRGSLLLQGELLMEWGHSGWMLSLATQLGHLASIHYDEPLEFQGEQRCDSTGCSRQRSYSDDTQMLMWNLVVSFIKSWG